MRISSINIKNYKSILDITIENPNPFTVFVGANSSGKSNIFEALTFMHYLSNHGDDAIKFFEGFNYFLNKKRLEDKFCLTINSTQFELNPKAINDSLEKLFKMNSDQELNNFIKNDFSFIFIENKKYSRYPGNKFDKLSPTCNNLVTVFRRIIKNEDIFNEVIELLDLFIPWFKNIEIKNDKLTGIPEINIYEKEYEEPFKGSLISDGTKNIISLITAVLQSDKPQFLCIEEPENGLNPKVTKELVTFFREKCEKKGHYIWLTTHSQAIVSELRKEEVIIVDKKDGETKIKQITDINLYDLKIDEAWLSNVFEGGIPW